MGHAHATEHPWGRPGRKKSDRTGHVHAKGLPYVSEEAVRRRGARRDHRRGMGSLSGEKISLKERCSGVLSRVALCCQLPHDATSDYLSECEWVKGNEMSSEVKIVCLAMSRKYYSHCVAGKIVGGEHDGKWVRPVSKIATGELSNSNVKYRNGELPKLGDIINVPLIKYSQHAHQNENYLNDAKEYWEKLDEIGYSEISNFVDEIEGPLWECGHSSTAGQNDRVPEHNAAAAVVKFGNSLCLIKVDNFVVSVRIEGQQFDNGRQKIRGCFDYKGHRYVLAITDPQITAEFSEIGEYQIGEALLTISLAGAHLGNAYKLIAAVFRP